MSISLTQSDWLRDFVDLVQEQYNVEAALAAAEQLPDENRGLAAIEHSLQQRGIAFGLPRLYPDMSDVADFPPIKFLSTLKHQAELIMDVAVALNRPFDGDHGQLALVMIWWATVGDVKRVEELAELWREVMTGQKEANDIVEALDDHFEPLAEELKKRAVLRPDPLLALPINQGISFFEIRIAGLMAVALYDDERLQNHEVERILATMHKDRILFVEATIALAWCNGILETEERNLIKKQIEVLKLQKRQKRKLINLMLMPSTPKDFAHSFSDRPTAMFVLRQLVIASMIDGEQDKHEVKFLRLTAKEFGFEGEHFQSILDEMNAFLEENREAIAQMKKYRRARPSLL